MSALADERADLVDAIAWALESHAYSFQPQATHAAAEVIETLHADFGAVPVDLAFASPRQTQQVETALERLRDAIEPWLGRDERAARAILRAARGC